MDSTSFCHSSSPYNCSSPDSEMTNSNPELLSLNNSSSTLEDQIRQSNNQIGTVILYGVPIVSLMMETKERLCLAQISSTLLKDYSYNEIHNRRVALGITCAQCTPVQLELLRRAGAMPVTSRRCGMITRREAERLCKSFLGDHSPPKLPENFAFDVSHCCAWGCRGAFLPSRYNSSRAKCIKCFYCSLFFSPNKFIFHSHRSLPDAKYVQPDAANFNSWRRHIHLTGTPPDQVMFAWEDVKAMFNGGSRKRVAGNSPGGSNVVTCTSSSSVGESAVAKPMQDVTQQQTKAAKTLKNPCASKRAKFENVPLPKIRQLQTPEVVSTAGTSTSSSAGPIAAPSPSTPQIYQHQQPQTLLARLNSIVPTAGSLLAKPTAVASDSPLHDYSMMWSAAGSGRFWSPYLNPLPFHPYSYYNYLINKTDQFSLMMNPSGGGWQQLVTTSKPRISPSSLQQQKNSLLEGDSNKFSIQANPSMLEPEEDNETFVDVESTDPTNNC